MEIDYSKLDKIHYSWRSIDGYNKAINIAISPREPGKTTSYWIEKGVSAWKRKECIVYCVRYGNEISDYLITSIFDNINKFMKAPLKPIYKADFSDGVVDIYLEENKEKFLAVRIIALNCKLRKLKQMFVQNLSSMFIDEYIINPETQESYLKSEAMKIKELYTTLKRGAPRGLKLYVAGNPYSMFNPLFLDLEVDVSRLKRGEKYIGENFIIDYATLHPALREKLLKENPFYKFDEDYSSYALEGIAINDINIPLSKMPINYSLRYVFKVSNKYIGIYKNNSDKWNEFNYFCQEEKVISKHRDVYVIDLADMITHSTLVTNDLRYYLNRFKDSVAKGNVAFSNINIYYLVKEIFKKI